MNEQKAESSEMQTDKAPIIEIIDMHKWFGEFHVLRGIDLTIQQKERIVICGPSGSGKSTLMNILGCLDTPSHGHYFLDGQDVAVLDDDEIGRASCRERV